MRPSFKSGIQDPMNSLRHIAQQLHVSHVTVSAALRGSPWVKGSTRERILRHVGRQGHQSLRLRPPVRGGRGVIAILRVTSIVCRCRAAVVRHRAIVCAVRESARKLGYDTAQLVLASDDLHRIPALVRDQAYRGLLVLPGPEPDMLRRILPLATPVIYTDAPGDEEPIDCVCPDYHQGISLAFNKLLTKGIRKPGLLLDHYLPLPAREQLLQAYSISLSAAGVRTAPPFFTPTRSQDYFSSWLTKNAFDSLLTTDSDYAARLVSPDSVPIYRIDLNFGGVARTAVERLHGQIVQPFRPAQAAPAVITVPWTVADYALG
jgi:DNA-binding LacI/PurR family transcriptional regulator